MMSNQETVDDLLRGGLTAGQMDGQTSLVVGGLGRAGILEEEGEDDALGGLFAACQVDGQISAAVLLGRGVRIGSEEGLDDWSNYQKRKGQQRYACEMTL